VRVERLAVPDAKEPDRHADAVAIALKAAVQYRIDALLPARGERVLLRVLIATDRARGTYDEPADASQLRDEGVCHAEAEDVLIAARAERPEREHRDGAGRVRARDGGRRAHA